MLTTHSLSCSCVHHQDPPEVPTGSAACTRASLTLQKLLRVCGHPLRLELQRVVLTLRLTPTKCHYSG